MRGPRAGLRQKANLLARVSSKKKERRDVEKKKGKGETASLRAGFPWRGGEERERARRLREPYDLIDLHTQQIRKEALKGKEREEEAYLVMNGGGEENIYIIRNRRKRGDRPPILRRAQKKREVWSVSLRKGD